MTNKVVIIGGNHQNPLGVIESLGRKGITPYVLVLSTLKRSFVLKSKYIKQGWICQTDEDAIRCLMINFTDIENKAVMFTCSDDAANLIDNNLNELKDYFFLPNAGEQGQLSIWMSKEKLTSTAVLFGLTIPKSWVIINGENIHEVEYPCITKSITSVKKGKADFRICNDINELDVYIKDKKNCTSIQVQKYIDKNYEFQFIGCSLNGGKEIIIPGRTHIVNDTNNFNNLVFLKYGPIETTFNELLKKCHNYILDIGYSGLFSVEFLKGKDGKDYFLEINFRNDGNAIAVTESGTNLPYIWYLFNIGADYRAEISASSVKEIFSLPEDSNFLDMVNGKISFSEWKNNIHKANSFLTYFEDDKAPFFALMRLQSKEFIKAIAKRILRELHIIH